jgi:hypothetical protein
MYQTGKGRYIRQAVNASQGPVLGMMTRIVTGAVGRKQTTENSIYSTDIIAAF